MYIYIFFLVIRDHEIKGRRVEIKKAIARDEINRDNRRGSSRSGGGMRDGRGGRDFRSKYLCLS